MLSVGVAFPSHFWRLPSRFDNLGIPKVVTSNAPGQRILRISLAVKSRFCSLRGAMKMAAVVERCGLLKARFRSG
jgi:hypothetical protein